MRAKLGRPFDLGWPLTVGALVFDHLGEPEELSKRVQEAERVGRENNLLFPTSPAVPLHSGIAFIRIGRVAEGRAYLRTYLRLDLLAKLPAGVERLGRKLRLQVALGEELTASRGPVGRSSCELKLVLHARADVGRH